MKCFMTVSYCYLSGLAPTLVQIFPHAGLQFGFYAFFKALWEMALHIKVHDIFTTPEKKQASDLVISLLLADFH